MFFSDLKNALHFSFVKFLLSCFIFSSAIFFPIALYISVAVMALGKAHSLGAWLGMWRAKKLNLKLILWISFVTISVSYFGIAVAPLKDLVFIGSVFFLFHFLYDEFEFSENKQINKNFLLYVAPACIVLLYLVSFYFQFFVPVYVYYIFFSIFFITALLLIKKFDWFFLNAFTISLFSVTAIALNRTPSFIFSALLLYHYMFWFMYPVYKLHVYKREERDGFIFILLLVVISSVFVYSSKVWSVENFFDELGVRAFYVASLVHIFTTAPFAYYFGLARPKTYA